MAIAQRTNMGANLSGTAKWSGIAAGPDGKLYCAPYDATDILVIDPVLPAGLYFKDTMGYLSTANGGFCGAWSFRECTRGLLARRSVLTVENRTTVAIQNVQIDVEEQPEEDSGTVAHGRSVCTGGAPLTLPGPYEDGSRNGPGVCAGGGGREKR